MSDYDNDDRFVLFTNKNKTKGSKGPDRTGRITISDELADAIEDGQREFDLAGWLMESKSGVKFLSGSIQMPYEADDEDDEEEKPKKKSKKKSKKKATKKSKKSKKDEEDDEDDEEDEDEEDEDDF